MKKDLYNILTIIVAFLIVLFLSFIPKSNVEKKIVTENKVKNQIKLIENKLGDSYTEIINKELTNDIINIVYENKSNEDYKSYFIDKNTGELTSYKSLFKSGKEKAFNEVETRLLYEKYPKFVVEGILKDQTKRVVYINNNSLIIKYLEVITEPQCTDKLSLTVNFNEIDNLINFVHDLDEEYQNESGYDYDPTKKYIAFTFDDGPNKKNTNDIVNFLNDNKMRATFFMVGYLMENNTDIVKNVYDNKMEIGSHSWAHNNLKKQKIEVITEEMAKTDAVYTSITNDTFKLMRPPYGSINDTVKESFNYSYILWSVDTNDWKYKDADHLYDFVVNNVNDGDIVLMHDLQYSTKVGLERVLPELYVRGYRVVTVSELANIKGKLLEPNKIYKSMK